MKTEEQEEPQAEQPDGSAAEGGKFAPSGHFMNLKGKDYLPVAARILWFRVGGGGMPACSIQDGWCVSTEITEGGMEAGYATVKASVWTPENVLVATGFKTARKGSGRGGDGFPDFIEKAETGAIGRALGLCGYGTMQAQDFDEGDSVCDSPKDERRPKGGAAGGKPVCSKCGKDIPAGRVALCKAKGQPIMCVGCA